MHTYLIDTFKEKIGNSAARKMRLQPLKVSLEVCYIAGTNRSAIVQAQFHKNLTSQKQDNDKLITDNKHILHLGSVLLLLHQVSTVVLTPWKWGANEDFLRHSISYSCMIYFLQISFLRC